MARCEFFAKRLQQEAQEGTEADTGKFVKIDTEDTVFVPGDIVLLKDVEIKDFLSFSRWLCPGLYG